MKLNYNFDGKIDMNIDFSISELLKVMAEVDRKTDEDVLVYSILQELKPAILSNLKGNLKVKKDSTSTPNAKKGAAHWTDY